MTTLIKDDSFVCTAPCGCSITRALPSGVVSGSEWLPSCSTHNPAELRFKERRKMLLASGDELCSARVMIHKDAMRKAESFHDLLESLRQVLAKLESYCLLFPGMTTSTDDEVIEAAYAAINKASHLHAESGKMNRDNTNAMAEAFGAMLKALQYAKWFGSQGTVIAFGKDDGKSVSYFIDAAIAKAEATAT